MWLYVNARFSHTFYNMIYILEYTYFRRKIFYGSTLSGRNESNVSKWGLIGSWWLISIFWNANKPSYFFYYFFFFSNNFSDIFLAVDFYALNTQVLPLQT